MTESSTDSLLAERAIERVYVRYCGLVDANAFARLGEVVRGKIVVEVGAGEWPRF